ncbi:unnamed protein product [Hyaloperonospora brassicae]|uniref:BRCT domain-containing protein n=1 Tax=Hyaloperonospora brassicae TaxID=162125 RepID=A0AAV0T8B4_HYABA|nr:unnamed protein product [Hyaloperonospora brassicae]
MDGVSTSWASASSPSAGVASDLSFVQPKSPSQHPSESFVESQQCSADPNAFLGYHVSPNTDNIAATGRTNTAAAQKQDKCSLKLVLDMDVAANDDATRDDGSCRRVRRSSSVDALSDDLFAADTQVDEDVVSVSVLVAAGEQKVQSGGRRDDELLACTKDQRWVSSPVMSTEIARQTQNQNVAEGCERVPGQQLEQQSREKEQQCVVDDAIQVCSRYSDPLSSRKTFQTALASNDAVVRQSGENTVAAGSLEETEESVVARGSFREADGDDEMDCTQPLEEAYVDAEETRNHAACSNVETEVHTLSRPAALLDGAEFAFHEKVLPEKTSGERREATDCARSQERLANIIVPDQLTGQRSVESKVTSRVGVQAMLLERSTPVVSFGQSEPSDVSVVVGGAWGTVELESKVLENEGDEDECMPTQPSSIQTGDDSVSERGFASPQDVEEIDEPVTREHIAGTDHHAKAIRSLQFSGSMPSSQEGEHHLSASLCGEGTLVAERLEVLSGSDKPRIFQSSASPIYQPASTPTPTDEVTAPDVAVASQASSNGMSSSTSDLSSGMEKLECLVQVVDHSSQNTFTPVMKKRKRGISSSPGNGPLTENGRSDPRTPQSLARRCTRSTQSTPSSTPKARTRTRVLSPVPSQRVYASRSRTLFKYKFEFCLTGFVKSGEENLKELIEGHGGRIPERYQDVLFKGNLRAVVIATPVSWRKRKFMQAVACGIPVVHTDWIKDCIEKGCVIPFDGYQVPTGYSVTTRKFECLPPRHLYIFEGYNFGIASDVAQLSKSEAKDKMNLIAFILKACGAKAVYENLTAKDTSDIDVVLCDEYTPTCRYYKKTKGVPVKGFQWVTECVILQRLVDPRKPFFEPLRVGRGELFAASTEIGDSDNTTLKLYTGELVLADIACSTADHYLLFSVCEILSIYVIDCSDVDSQSRRKDCNEGRIMLRVGMLKREPYDPELSKTPVKVLDISSSQVKRRVVAISKEHYSQLKYKDESIFYLENGGSPTSSPCRSTSS